MLSDGITPWEHQTRGFEFGKNKKSVGLSMPMGTGKTLTAAMLVDHWKPRSILIVSPDKISRDPRIWPRHLQQFITNPYSIEVLSGRLPKDREQIYTRKPDRQTAYLVNNETVWRDPLAKKLLKEPPDLLIVDESHHAKSPTGKLSRFLYKLGRRCERKILGTGTFLPHTPVDSWMQTRILDDRILPSSFYQFKLQHAVMGGFMGKEILSGKNGVPWLHQDRLGRTLSRIWFSCEKPPLPFEVQYVVRQFDLTPLAMDIYKKLRDHFALTIGEHGVSAPLTITRLVRILQVCSGFIPADATPGDDTRELISLGDGRMQLLAEVLQEIDPQEKVVVFVANFSRDFENIWEACKIAGRPYFEISGGASQAAEWRQTEGAVVGVHMRSGGEGLDLTASRYAIMYSHQHSPGPRDQAECRVTRHPESREKETRFVIDLVSNTPVELSMVDSLQRRKDVIQNLYEVMRTGA